MLPLVSLRPKRRLLGALVLVTLVPLGALACGCCGLGGDNQNQNPPPPAASASATPSSTAISDALPSGAVLPGVNPAASGEPTQPSAPAAGERQIAGAAHVLIAFKGAERAPKTVTRSKDDAKKRAQEALNKLKSDKTTFEEIVKQYSDDDVSKAANGAVGNFERNAMPAAFADATFGMEVGALSDIVETPQGFHIIKRTK